MKKVAVLGVIVIGILLNSCGKSYDEYLEQGREFQSAKNYESALVALDNAIQKAETGDERISTNIMAANLAAKYIKDFEKANLYFEAALADAGNYSPEDLHDLAKQALAAQANKAAVSMYTLWFEKFSDAPNLVAMKYEFAEVYHKNILDLKKAISVYGEIVDTFPESEQAPKALFSIGYIYANELGENDAAKKYYSMFIEKYPNHEMAPSVEFELKYIGKSLEEIPELQHLLTKTS